MKCNSYFRVTFWSLDLLPQRRALYHKPLMCKVYMKYILLHTSLLEWGPLQLMSNALLIPAVRSIHLFDTFKWFLSKCPYFVFSSHALIENIDFCWSSTFDRCSVQLDCLTYPLTVLQSGSNMTWAKDVTCNVESKPSVPWTNTEEPKNVK